jgi:hypothetical protein
VLWAVLCLVVLWIGAACVMILVGSIDASHGVGKVGQAEAHLSPGDIVSESPVGLLSEAHHDFSSASSLLHSPLLAPIDVLPVLGRQLRSVQDLSSAAAVVSQVGVSAVGQVRSVIDRPHKAGPDRVATLQRLAQLASRTHASLAKVDLGPSQALFSFLASKRNAFLEKLDHVQSELTNASSVTEALAGILKGPKTYLLLMANNAEMRAGSGMFLEVGILTASDGEMHLTNVEPSPAFNLEKGQVQVTGQLEANWGWLLPGVDWRNLGLTPQFDVNGPLAARMWQAATGQQVDGVLAVDVETLRQLLSVTGPVEVPQVGSIGEQNVVQFLTHDQYAGLSDSSTQAQAARQDELGSIAHSVLNVVQDQSLDLKALANAMTSATEGRHVLIWSSDPVAERAWRQGGVAGALSPSSMMVSVMNQGGNKLDQYLSVGATVSSAPVGREHDVELKVHLDNQTPPGQSQFVAGPYPGIGDRYGEYLGIVSLNLPAGARDIRIQGHPPLVAAGVEGPTWLVAFRVDVPQGASQDFSVSFVVPSDMAPVTVLPSARLSEISWTPQNSRAAKLPPFELRL